MLRWPCAALAAAFVLASSGCGIIDKELNNRGGYVDYLADKYWFAADTKGMRLLRSYVLQASLARIAAVTSKNADERGVILTRINNATRAGQEAYDCVAEEWKTTAGGICVFFDDLMVQYADSVFALAMSALPIAEAQDLVGKVTGAASPIGAALGGMDLLRAMIEFARDAFTVGRRAAALYRDTVELEMIVAIYNLNGFKGTYPELAPIYDKLVHDYAGGAGNLKLWKADLESIQLQYYTLFQPVASHFDAVSSVMRRACAQVLPSGEKAENCRVLQTGTAVVVGVSTVAPSPAAPATMILRANPLVSEPAARVPPPAVPRSATGM